MMNEDSLVSLSIFRFYLFPETGSPYSHSAIYFVRRGIEQTNVSLRLLSLRSKHYTGFLFAAAMATIVSDLISGRALIFMYFDWAYLFLITWYLLFSALITIFAISCTTGSTSSLE